MPKAKVMRGSYTVRGKDGASDRIVRPDDKDPYVDVPEDHLTVFQGILVPAADEAIEAAKIRAENARGSANAPAVPVEGEDPEADAKPSARRR